jgi:hypothetical protein
MKGQGSDNFRVIEICMNFVLFQGFYRGGRFVFNFKVGQGYPHDAPKVKCETMVYHPNIDLEGNVCLNILRYHDNKKLHVQLHMSLHCLGLSTLAGIYAFYKMMVIYLKPVYFLLILVILAEKIVFCALFLAHQSTTCSS